MHTPFRRLLVRAGRHLRDRYTGADFGTFDAGRP
jgi:hypothetical protein